jgi:hypothetical protein
LLNNHLGLIVLTLAELMMADLSRGVDEVEGRPVVVVEGAPDRVVVVNRDRVADPQVLDGSADVVQIVLDVELGGVHADHDQPVIPVFLGPGAEVGQGAEPVDAGVGPEVDQHHTAAQPLCGKWRRVEPVGRAREGRHPSFNGQLDHRRVRRRAEEPAGVSVHVSLLEAAG